MFSHLSFQCFCPHGIVHAFMQGALWGNPMARVPLTASPVDHEHINLFLSLTRWTSAVVFPDGIMPR